MVGSRLPRSLQREPAGDLLQQTGQGSILFEGCSPPGWEAGAAAVRSQGVREGGVDPAGDRPVEALTGGSLIPCPDLDTHFVTFSAYQRSWSRSG